MPMIFLRSISSNTLDSCKRKHKLFLACCMCVLDEAADRFRALRWRTDLVEHGEASLLQLDPRHLPILQAKRNQSQALTLSQHRANLNKDHVLTASVTVVAPSRRYTIPARSKSRMCCRSDTGSGANACATHVTTSHMTIKQATYKITRLLQNARCLPWPA